LTEQNGKTLSSSRLLQWGQKGDFSIELDWKVHESKAVTAI
jgi:hypothetical protein